jgi:DNA sulfur modification protein DndB
MRSEPDITFPAIKGRQAAREYYVAMCPLKIIPRLFKFDEEDSSLSPEVRAQRILNKGRIPELARYVVNNKEDYVFSAITASIDGKVRFEPIEPKSKHGDLIISMHASFIINDGQHRRAAIEEAIKQEPTLGQETIAVVFFIDKGLERSQQMFADLNRHAVKPSRSLGLLYDHRDDMAKISRLVAIKSDAFKGLVEMEKSSLSERSGKLFTLSAIHTGCQALLESLKIKDYEKAYVVCEKYWNAVASQFDDWKQVQNSKILSSDIRQEKMHTHAISLQSFGIIGSQLLKNNKQDWEKIISKLNEIDWRRSNAEAWEGRTLIGGRIAKTTTSIILTVNYIKQFLGMELTEEEQHTEEEYLKGK